MLKFIINNIEISVNTTIIMYVKIIVVLTEISILFIIHLMILTQRDEFY